MKFLLHIELDIYDMKCNQFDKTSFKIGTKKKINRQHKTSSKKIMYISTLMC